MPDTDPAFPQPPLILTLEFRPEQQERFERLRQAHFPQQRNVTPAHVTLFHHLPGTEFPLIDEQLRHAAASADTEVSVTGVRSLGRGTAFTMEAPGIARLRSGIAREWHERLTAQDRQSWRPHLTIQNKVSGEAARTLLAAMQAEFSPFIVQAHALNLWRYLGGPWDRMGRYRLGAS